MTGLSRRALFELRSLPRLTISNAYARLMAERGGSARQKWEGVLLKVGEARILMCAKETGTKIREGMWLSFDADGRVRRNARKRPRLDG